jgi:hypothetical protein
MHACKETNVENRKGTREMKHFAAHCAFFLIININTAAEDLISVKWIIIWGSDANLFNFKRGRFGFNLVKLPI